MHTGVPSSWVVWHVFFERYTRVLMEASPEFPIHFLKIYRAASSILSPAPRGWKLRSGPVLRCHLSSSPQNVAVASVGNRRTPDSSTPKTAACALDQGDL